MKLSMSVDRLPFADGVPLEERGRLKARICVSDGAAFGRDVTLLSDDRGEFALDDIAAMLRVFAEHLTRPAKAA